MIRIAVIPPIGKADYLTNTVLDGLIDLKSEIEFRTMGNYPTPFSIYEYVLQEDKFIEYATQSDLIILCWGKEATNYELVERMNQWGKTIFVDGSEVGKNNRFNQDIQHKILNMTYDGQGSIDRMMLEKCKRYFRREKPYIAGILPFPFGIERRYRKYAHSGLKKDIDFVCIFGQEDYPVMRRDVRLIVEEFSRTNGFISVTKKTSGFTFDDTSKQAGRDEFYSLLARARVGVSVGGGGYDTARFWEIYGNNCILLTEKIDIEMPEGQELNYSRIKEFSTVKEFRVVLEQVARQIDGSYKFDTDVTIEKHTTRARVMYLLEKSL